jgi:hypothetical protein
MTRSIVRKGQVGQAGNKGHFAKGSFAPADDDVDIAVDEDPLSQREKAALGQRLALIRSGRYVKAVSTDAVVDPSTTAGIDDYWDGAFYTSEYRPNQAGYIPQMPDDETPKKSAGRAMSEHRRTHRMKYEGGGVEVRMPSATAMRRFADRLPESQQTFDMPVTAKYPGGSVTGWVRCTRHGNHDWSTEPLNFSDPKGGAVVSEAVESIASSKRPTMALSEAGETLAARRSQKMDHVEVMSPAKKSSFISQLGYRRSDQTAVVAITSKTKAHPDGITRTYGYRASPDEVMEVAKAGSRGSKYEGVGQAYNKVLKRPADGSERRVEMVACQRCGEPYPSGSAHKCRDKVVDHRGTKGLAQRQKFAARNRVADPARAKRIVSVATKVGAALRRTA